MLNMRATNATDAFVKINEHLMCYPEHELEVRGLKTKEVTNFRIAIEDPTSNIVAVKNRNISLRYMVGELCWYLRGSDKTGEIAHYSKFWNKISDDGVHANSAYGKRLFYDRCGLGLDNKSQFDYVIDELRRDKYSRKAVMTIYKPTDSMESKDNPCTLSLQFLIRKDQLDLTVTMRSNDLYFGFCYDVTFFTLIQQMVHEKMSWMYPELIIGNYFHNAGSMHMYEKDFAKAESVIDDPRVDHEIPLGLPMLVADDIENWFHELLLYERAMVRGIGTHQQPETTHFQNVCLKILGEK